MQLDWAADLTRRYVNDTAPLHGAQTVPRAWFSDCNRQRAVTNVTAAHFRGIAAVSRREFTEFVRDAAAKYDERHPAACFREDEHGMIWLGNCETTNTGL